MLQHGFEVSRFFICRYDRCGVQKWEKEIFETAALEIQTAPGEISRDEESAELRKRGNGNNYLEEIDKIL